MLEPWETNLKAEDAADAALAALELNCVHLWTEMTIGVISKSN